VRDIWTPSGAVGVPTPRRSAAKRCVRVHESGALDPALGIWRDADGLPVTTSTRTPVDLADVLALRRLRRAVGRAVILRPLDVGGVVRRLDTPLRAGCCGASTPCVGGVLRRLDAPLRAAYPNARGPPSPAGDARAPRHPLRA
jgi:hypothetical protein